MRLPRPESPDFQDDVFTARRALLRRRRRRRLRRGAAGGLLGVIGLAVCAGLAAGAGVLFSHVREESSFFKVRRVDVGRTRWVPPWEIADAVGIAPGDDLLDVSPEDVEIRIERHPWVLEANVTRTWTGTLHVDVVERPPVAAWLGSRLLEIAADGTVLGPAPEGPERDWPASGPGPGARGLELPLLTGVDAGDLEAGNVILDPGAREALSFLARLRAYGEAGETWLSEVWAGKSGDLVAVTLEGGIPVRVGDGRLTPRKVRALRSVLDRVHGEETPPSQVDVRFRHQVIVKAS